MKKLSLLAGLLCFVFVACCPKTEEPKQEEVAATECSKEHKCCKSDMTEEQKAECKEFCEKWKDWENLTDEVKQELIAKKKACFDKKYAEMEAKMEACKAEWANFDNLSLDEQKALIDKKMQCGKKHCCKKDGEGKKCHKAENAE